MGAQGMAKPQLSSVVQAIRQIVRGLSRTALVLFFSEAGEAKAFPCSLC